MVLAKAEPNGIETDVEVILEYYGLDAAGNVVFYRVNMAQIPGFADAFTGITVDNAPSHPLDAYYKALGTEFETGKFSNPKMQQVFDAFAANIGNLPELIRTIGLQP